MTSMPALRPNPVGSGCIKHSRRSRCFGGPAIGGKTEVAPQEQYLRDLATVRARAARIERAEALEAKGDEQRKSGVKNLIKTGLGAALGIGGLFVSGPVGWGMVALGTAGTIFFGKKANKDLTAGRKSHEQALQELTAPPTHQGCSCTAPLADLNGASHFSTGLT